MNKLRFKSVFKNTFLELILCLTLLFTAFLISTFSSYLFKDILFIEGIILILLSTLSFSESYPFTSSCRTISQFSSQFISKSIIYIPDEKRENKIIDEKPTNKVTLVSLIVCGLILIIINFLI